MPITLAHYLYTTVSDSEPQKEMTMKTHENITELLEDYTEKLNRASVNRVKILTSIFIKDYASSNSLSDCERQPVSDNEQTESVCDDSCEDYYSCCPKCYNDFLKWRQSKNT